MHISGTRTRTSIRELEGTYSECRELVRPVPHAPLWPARPRPAPAHPTRPDTCALAPAIPTFVDVFETRIFVQTRAICSQLERVNTDASVEFSTTSSVPK